jgi:hypothetical protein
MPIFFSILFGIFEFTYIYRAKATLNAATFEAARQGSLNHARLGDMSNALTNGMLAEFVKGNKNFTGILSASLNAKVAETVMNKALPLIEVVSPTKEIFQQFKVKRLITLSGETKEKYIEIIPNDNLSMRSTATKNIEVDKKSRKITIQDANLLKIKSYWCYEMKVPIIKDLIYEIISVNASKEQLACNKLTFAANLFTQAKYFALSSQSIVRMQSPVIIEGNNLK